MKDIYGDKYISIPDAALYLHLDKSTVWKLIKKGRLKAVNIGNGNYRSRWGILLEDLNEFAGTYVKWEGCGRGPRTHYKRVKKKDVDSMRQELKELSNMLLDISIRLEQLSEGGSYDNNQN